MANLKFCFALVVFVAFTSAGLAGGVADLRPGRHPRETPRQCRQMAGPLDYLYGYGSRNCACRSTSSCRDQSQEVEEHERQSSRKLCLEKDVGNRQRVSVTLNIIACCGQNRRNIGENFKVEISQANRYGTYSQRSGCAATLYTNGQGQVSFQAPVPGGVTFGADGAEDVPHMSHGPVNVVVHGRGKYVTTSVRLLYPGTNLNPAVLTLDSGRKLKCNHDFNINNPTNTSECTFDIDMDCKAQRNSKEFHEEFIDYRNEQMKLPARRNRRRPPVEAPGCRKLMNLQKTYTDSSVAMIVEICHPDGKGGSPCNDRKLRDFVSKRQSFYLARPLSVLREDSGTFVNERLSTLTSFHRQHTKGTLKENLAVIVDHYTEVECCNELAFGKEYLVMGMPLPTSPATNQTLRVVRLWAEMVESTHTALRYLLSA